MAKIVQMILILINRIFVLKTAFFFILFSIIHSFADWQILSGTTGQLGHFAPADHLPFHSQWLCTKSSHGVEPWYKLSVSSKHDQMDIYLNSIYMIQLKYSSGHWAGGAKISWQLIPWLLASPSHQQPWYWAVGPCRPKWAFNYLCQLYG